MLKVYINCKSILLQKSLEIFLKNYKASYKTCEVVISDRMVKTEKPLLTIGYKSNDSIKKPFTKSSLMLALDKEKQKLELSKSMNRLNDLEKDDKIDIEIQIEKLTEKFAKDLAQILKSRIV